MEWKSSINIQHVFAKHKNSARPYVFASGHNIGVRKVKKVGKENLTTITNQDWVLSPFVLSWHFSRRGATNSAYECAICRHWKPGWLNSLLHFSSRLPILDGCRKWHEDFKFIWNPHVKERSCFRTIFSSIYKLRIFWLSPILNHLRGPAEI